MDQAHKPAATQAPSRAQLRTRSLIALAVAIVLLITVVLPAERGIDITGVGRLLQLQQMGETKMALAALDDHGEEEPATPVPPPAADADTGAETAVEASATADAAVANEPTANREVFSAVIAPDQAIEVKVGMRAGATVRFRWSTDRGHLNVDVHGDNAEVDYQNYSKGKRLREDEGELTAAFDGNHGWYWRNRSGEPVAVTLEVSGDFEGLARVM